MSLLTVKQLCIERNHQTIIHQLSFTLEEHQRLFLQGDIGTGKTTLLHCLLGFIPFAIGEIHWFGKHCLKEDDFVAIRGKVGICFQHVGDQLFGPTVLDDVAFGPLNQGLTKTQAYAIAQQQLDRLDIAHLANRSITALSGGEQNFTALAGVLAMQPTVLLLDEPSNGLDKKSRDKLITLLKELDLPMIVASHDEQINQALASDFLLLEKATTE